MSKFSSSTTNLFLSFLSSCEGTVPYDAQSNDLLKRLLDRAIDLLVLGELHEGNYHLDRDEQITTFECLGLLVEKKEVGINFNVFSPYIQGPS
jgi:hypothetical protein